ncbi:MAG: phosphotriesterase [Oscillospiraceae bacterium]|jgi:phosphotriesterase-related protein|nr:phosphotriesterase [Oscillospiraceae bacterium]
MTAAIVTVLGPLPPAQLGFCQSHEHISAACAHLRAHSPGLVIDDEQRTLTDLLAYRRAGGQALVDAQPLGAGRDARALVSLSRASGVHVVASTGFHLPRHYPDNHWVHTLPQQALQALFTDELTRGMYLDGDEAPPARQGEARAGQVKAALEPGPLTGRQGVRFAAAAGAAIAAGAPLMVHIEPRTDPLALADFLAGQGLDLTRAVFCHMDRATPDLVVHRALCERGITLEYDTIARPKYHDDAREAEIFRHMLRAGYGNRLLAGLDVTRLRLTGYGGTPGLAGLLQNFVPLLRDAGVTEAQITQIFVENPARIFQMRPTIQIEE